MSASTVWTEPSMSPMKTQRPSAAMLAGVAVIKTG
jgi:hypothetical protein